MAQSPDGSTLNILLAIISSVTAILVAIITAKQWNDSPEIKSVKEDLTVLKIKTNLSFETFDKTELYDNKQTSNDSQD